MCHRFLLCRYQQAYMEHPELEFLVTWVPCPVNEGSGGERRQLVATLIVRKQWMGGGVLLQRRVGGGTPPAPAAPAILESSSRDPGSWPGSGREALRTPWGPPRQEEGRRPRGLPAGPRPTSVPCACPERGHTPKEAVQTKAVVEENENPVRHWEVWAFYQLNSWDVIDMFFPKSIYLFLQVDTTVYILSLNLTGFCLFCQWFFNFRMKIICKI